MEHKTGIITKKDRSGCGRGQTCSGSSKRGRVMQNKMRYTEENIEKLLQASYCKEERLDDQLKEDTLLLLEQFQLKQ
jgi:hypothetical protein